MGEKDENEKKLSEQAVFRVAIVLGVVLALFLGLRQLAIPKSFGEYGYYRGDNISEWASMEIIHADSREKCRKCHQKAVVAVSSGIHKGLDCQSCHGPAVSHLKNLKESMPKIVDSVKLCSFCHKEIAARSIEQVTMVIPGVHSGGLNCTRCHQPHQPKR